jgi:hypothetical protein
MKLFVGTSVGLGCRRSWPPRLSSSGRTNGTGVLDAAPTCGPIGPAILVSGAFHPRARDHSVVAANSMNA